MSTRALSWCLARSGVLVAATGFACGACESAVTAVDAATSSNPGPTSAPRPTSEGEDDAGAGVDAGGRADAGREAGGDARSAPDADAGVVAVDATVPPLPPLDLRAKETDHGLPTPATTVLKRIVFTDANQQRALTYLLQSSSPFDQLSPPAPGAAYADDCTPTGATSPTEYGLVSNASATALYVFLSAYVSAPAAGPPPVSSATRVFAFDAIDVATAGATTCLTPLAYASMQVVGDQFPPLPPIYTLNGKTYRESRVVTLNREHPAPTVLWDIQSTSSGYWGGQWQSVHVVEQNCGLWCPISETVEGTGALALPIRVGAGKSVLFLAQVEHADMASITMVAESALPE